MYFAYSTESRAILSLLGFGGVRSFAARAAINHWTAAELVGTAIQIRGKHPAQIVRAWNAATEAWLERKAALNAAQRRHVLDWFRRWKKRLLAAAVIEHSDRAGTDKYELKRRERRMKAKAKALDAALSIPG